MKSEKQDQFLRQHHIRHVCHEDDCDVDDHEHGENKQMRLAFIKQGGDEFPDKRIHPEITLGAASDAFGLNPLKSMPHTRVRCYFQDLLRLFQGNYTKILQTLN